LNLFSVLTEIMQVGKKSSDKTTNEITIKCIENNFTNSAGFILNRIE